MAPLRRPTSAVQDYLKSIWALEQDTSEPVTTTALARRLGLSVSTVSGMVQRLVDAGLIAHRSYGDLLLTPDGRQTAVAVVRRHRILEAYLVAELGYTWDEVHDEAEVLEHAVSDRLLERLAAHLGEPSWDPHGDPIPRPDGTIPTRGGRRLSTLEPGSVGSLTRVDDSRPALLRWLTERGIALGDKVEVLSCGPLGDSFEVRVGSVEDPLVLGPAAAAALEIVVDTR
jgi:DtxR family Mn-dependent transcriptional regulator